MENFMGNPIASSSHGVREVEQPPVSVAAFSSVFLFFLSYS